MPGEVMNCREARLRMEAYLAGESCPELDAHLSECDTCLDACMEAALRRTARVSVPEHFSQRLLARLPEAPPETPRHDRWVLAGTAICCAALVAALWWNGDVARIAESLERAVPLRAALLAAGGMETTLSLLWFWRVCREP